MTDWLAIAQAATSIVLLGVLVLVFVRGPALISPPAPGWRLTLLEAKLAAVLQHLGVRVDDPLPPRVRDRLSAGRKLDAIKAYREETGTDLRQAKEAVERNAGLARLDAQADALLRHYGLAVPNVLTDQVKALLRAGKKIEAIRVYREATGAGLKDAKDAVEAMQRELA